MDVKAPDVWSLKREEEKDTHYFCTVNSNTVNNNMACISTELADLIYNKVENSQVPSVETIKQE